MSDKEINTLYKEAQKMFGDLNNGGTMVEFFKKINETFPKTNTTVMPLGPKPFIKRYIAVKNSNNE